MPSSRLSVYSEIGRLREVLVHAPGPEVDSMPPAMMSELLFDDIIHGPAAREEHARMCSVMERFGVVVRDTKELLTEALRAAAGSAPGLVEDVARLERLDREVAEELSVLAPEDLAAALVHGVPARRDEIEPGYLFRLHPLSNLLFTRDAQAILGSGAVFAAMSRRARQREPLLGRFLFRHHPEFREIPVIHDFLEGRQLGRAGHITPTIEGGDILILGDGEGKGVIVVGVSERTMERAVDHLVQALRGHRRFHTLIMVPMPRTRSVMHLDTIFTRVSREECLIYEPMIRPGGVETLSVLSVDLRRTDDWGVRRPSLLEALGNKGLALEPIPCGGSESYIQQAREQWTDGANSFAIAPGVVLLYARNEATARELETRGYRVVSVSDMAFDAEGRCVERLEDGARYAILVAGEELSRARGGPRCMTLPLVRDEI